MNYLLTNIRKSREEIIQLEELLHNYYSEISGVYNNPKNLSLAKKEARSEKFAIALNRGKIIGFVKIGKEDISTYYLRPDFKDETIFKELIKFAENKIKENKSKKPTFKTKITKKINSKEIKKTKNSKKIKNIKKSKNIKTKKNKTKIKKIKNIKIKKKAKTI